MNALARQLYLPVRWTECVGVLAKAGATKVVECGPGKVLGALTRRIDGSLHGLAIADATSLTQALQTLQQAG